MAVLTLSLGIGANTAIFSVVNGVLLKRLPFPESDRLVEVMRGLKAGNDDETVEASKFIFWQQHSRVFDGHGRLRHLIDLILNNAMTGTKK